MNLAEEVAAHGTPGAYIAVPFPARLDGNAVMVTAVLNRTAVYHRGDVCDRHLELLERFEVKGPLRWHLEDAGSDRIRSQRGRRAALRGRGFQTAE